ncbi:ABC transporter permease [Goodfellowiella coeruleoviolacea]|uniref:Transport permease protein n=1 Tax=Goodfellowiella coeruleoviolacea TaxID=334858 RepID=A0AAE3GHQ4_9PSEU|nr:ABC transporter permease [Goodfellowiella coeruleoviolacea]MCP2168451.1 ABC-2 type transport system permease protein [Goodfellowiella coeruleoviolacea]
MDRLGALVRHNALLLRRDPGPVLSRLCMPVLLMVVFEPLYRAAAGTTGEIAIRDTAPRVLVTFSMFAVSTVGVTMIAERTWRTWSWLRATPASAWELVAGKSVPLLGVLLVQQVLVLGLARIAFGLSILAPPLLLFAGLAWALCILACGVLLATFAHSPTQLSSFADVGGLLLSSVGGALVPITLMPAWLRDIAPVSPAYWGVRALRAAVVGDGVATLAAVAVLLVLALAAGWLACWRINRHWSRPELL